MGTKGSFKLFGSLTIFSVVSVLSFSLEFQAFDNTHTNSLGRQDRIEPAAKLPLSHRARLDMLQRCDQELSAHLSLIKTGASLEQNANSCLSISQKITTSTPSFGFAYLVAAKSHAHLGHPNLARAALAKSAAMAQFEGWQIQRRLRLSLELSVPPDQISDDISVLLTTQSGAELIVTFYIKDAEIRAFIDDSLRVAADTDQTRFLNLLRKYSARF